MKKILVPCDFSDPAVQAFKFAVEIARKSRGEITLLHVIELPILYDSAAVLSFEENYLKERKANAEKNFAKMKEKWAKGGPKVSTAIEYGGAIHIIKKYLDGKKTDLVVTGTTGATGLKEFTVGSNTEKIVRTSPVPVIAIRKVPAGIKEIVFPTRPDMDLEEITMKVKDLQDFFGARLHVLYVNTPALFRKDAETKSNLQAFAKRFMLKNCTLNIYNDITEEEGIANFAKDVKADMIALRTHGRKGLARLASGSIAEDVVNHINCPIWTYRIKG